MFPISVSSCKHQTEKGGRTLHIVWIHIFLLWTEKEFLPLLLGLASPPPSIPEGWRTT